MSDVPSLVQAATSAVKPHSSSVRKVVSLMLGAVCGVMRVEGSPGTRIFFLSVDAAAVTKTWPNWKGYEKCKLSSKECST